MAAPTALFLDLFGTLVDDASEREAVEAAMREVRDRFEVPEPAAELAGDFAVLLMDRVLDEPPEGPVAPFEAAARDALDALLADRGLLASEADRAWFWGVLLDRTREHVRAFPDARPAVEAATELVAHVGVVTDADPAIAALLLEASGLASSVASVTTGAEAGAFKPDPAPFELALRRADASADAAVMVGDSWERDVEPALALGMKAVLLDRHGARTVPARWRVRTLAELPALLDAFHEGPRRKEGG